MKDVTILLPCLNEEETLELCIKKIKKVMEKTKYNYEILVCDNGSSDSSVQIAKKNKVRYCIENKKGYGNTLINGINNANGNYIVMLDCDLSYNEKDILKFISCLEQGYELVIGNRYKGKIEKKAMPFIHKIGSKMLSVYSNFLFKNDIKDYHCGLRAFKKDSIIKLNLCSQGMEFASEMIIKAKIHHLKAKNINTNYYKDKRNRKSHLRTFRDGFRHFTLINKLKYNSSKVFKYVITFIITFILLISLLYLSALIPQNKIYNHTIESFKYYYNNDKIGYLNNSNLQKEYYRIDYSADMKSLSMAYLVDEKRPLSSIIEMNYYQEIDYGLKDFSKFIQNNSGKITNYSRYWQGQTIYLRSLLVFTNIKNIYFISICLFFIIFIVLLIKLLIKDLKLCISFFLSSIIISLFIVPYCFEYFFVFIIAFLGSIYLLKLMDKKSKNIDALFLVLGMVTCFFDFLTCETITLTLPLFIYSYLILKSENKIDLKKIIKYILLWFIGYSLMFGLKWLIDYIFYGKYFLYDFFNKASIRVYSKNTNVIKLWTINFIKIIKCIFPFNKLKYTLTFTVFTILITIYNFIFNEKKKGKYYAFILISMIPIIRFLLLPAHVSRHNFFVYRAILPIAMLFILFYVNTLLNQIKKVENSFSKF